jgi:uncharacterized paraquat-inducible protein A
VTASPDTISRIPECPDCGARIDLVRVILNKPFPCPSCGRQLIVAEPYVTRLRRFCNIVALIAMLLIAYRFWMSGRITAGRSWLVLLVVILTGCVAEVVAAMFGGIFLKRIFVPQLEDYEESKRKPRYTAF